MSSKVIDTSWNEDTNTLTILVAHSPHDSYSRSVKPCAERAFHVFMKSAQGQAVLRAGVKVFDRRADFSDNGVAKVHYIGGIE